MLRLLKNIKGNVVSRASEDNALYIAKSRILFSMIAVSIMFLILCIRMWDLGLASAEDIKLAKKISNNDFVVERASILDRNGNVLASNLTTASLYANPHKIIDRQAAVSLLCDVFKGKRCLEIEKKLTSDKPFVWLKRHLTPTEQQIVHDLGIAGIGLMRDEKRVYPHANLFAHTIGYVDIDGNGLSGVEQYFDQQLKNDYEPLQLTIDTRIQQVLREEILEQAKAHNAIGGSGVVMNAKNGEVLALVSLPDFDPHDVGSATERQRFNQVTLGAYEMGSTFKVATLAMGLDGKHVELNDVFNTDSTIMIGKKKISNYRGKGGLMTVPEILMYSSNIGSAQVAMKVGISNQRSYLKDFGLLSPVPIELPETAHPLYPPAKLWSQASLITISYGHGIAVTPLHVAQVMGAIVNGKLVRPTLLKTFEDKIADAPQVLSEKSVEMMRKLLRLVVIDGYGKKANVEGYFVGGKTGTAEKLSGRTYTKNANLASFMGAFPMHDPEYVVVVLIDEALPNKENGGFTTGGMLAAPVAGRIIERIAPILSVKPRNAEDQDVIEKLTLRYNPKNPMTLQKIHKEKPNAN